MDYILRKGKHQNPEQGVCAMELVAYVAGEEHSDHPACVNHTLARIFRHLNDYAPSEELRQRLKPLLMRTIGVTGLDPLAVQEFKSVQIRLMWMLVDRAISAEEVWLDLVNAAEQYLLPPLVQVEIPEVTQRAEEVGII